MSKNSSVTICSEQSCLDIATKSKCSLLPIFIQNCSSFYPLKFLGINDFSEIYCKDENCHSDSRDTGLSFALGINAFPQHEKAKEYKQMQKMTAMKKIY